MNNGQHILPTITQVFYYEICRIFKNTWFEEHLWPTNYFPDLKHGIQVYFIFFFQFTYSKANFEAASFYVSLSEIDCIKLQTMNIGWFWTYLSKDYLCFIYFDVMTCKQQKKSSSCWTFFQSCEWSKNMWYCAITDNVHAQWSYLTVAQLTDVEWRSVLKVH